MFRMAAFPTDMYPDTIQVETPGTTLDTDGSPDPATGATLGAEILAAVQQVVTSGLVGRYEPGSVPFGVNDRNVLTADDPGVFAAEMWVLWTKSNGVAISPPIRMQVNAIASRPGSIGARWTTPVTIRE